METQTHTTQGTGDHCYKQDDMEMGQNQNSSWKNQDTTEVLEATST